MRMRLIVMIVVGVLAGLVSNAAAQEKAQQFRVKVPSCAVIHNEASLKAARITCVPEGTVMKVVNVDSAKQWVKVVVSVNGLQREGYVYHTTGALEPLQPFIMGSDGTTPAPVAVAPAPKPPADPAPAKTSSATPASRPAPRPATASASQSAGPAKPVMAPATAVSQPGPFGVGLQAGIASVGGMEPSVIYDFKSPTSLRGLFDFGSGWSAIGVQGLYRFKTQPTTSVSIVPFVGGGLTVLTISNLGSYKGFLGSGGVFLTLKSLPALRFTAEVDVPVFGVDYGSPIYGTYLGVGAHYFFKKQ